MANIYGGGDVRDLFGKNLKAIRVKQKLSQVSLSRKAGLAHNFVNDIENGKKWVSPETIAKLAQALDTDPGDFFATSPLDAHEINRIRGYLDKINDRFARAVGEIKAEYLVPGGGSRELPVD